MPRSSMRRSAISCLGAESSPQGRPRRLRGHSYERHPELSVSDPVGRAANSCRSPISRGRTGIDFLRLAPEIGIVTKTTSYPLNQANQALADLRAGRFEGAAVLVP